MLDKLNELTEGHGALRLGHGMVSGIVALTLAILCFLGVLVWKGSEFSIGLVWAIGMIYLELALVTAIAMFFSSFTSPYLAGMFTVALWIIGHLLADLRAFGRTSDIAGLKELLETLYWTLPNLDRLDFKADASAGNPIELARAGMAALYAGLYSLALMAGAIVLFQRRDFR